MKLFQKSSWPWMFGGMMLIILIGSIMLTRFNINAQTNETAVFGKTVAEALRGGRKVSHIYAEEKTANGVLVFYLPVMGGDQAQSELGLEYLQRTLRGWKMNYRGGMYTSSLQQKLYFEFFPDDQDQATPLPLFYGEIKDPGITAVSVIDLQLGEEQQAKIISVSTKSVLNKEMRLWYVSLNRPDGNIFEIRGKNAEEQVLFSERVDVKRGSFAETRAVDVTNCEPFNSKGQKALGLCLRFLGMILAHSSMI